MFRSTQQVGVLASPTAAKSIGQKRKPSLDLAMIDALALIVAVSFLGAKKWCRELKVDFYLLTLLYGT